MTRLSSFAGLALATIVVTTGCGTSPVAQTQPEVSSTSPATASVGPATPSPQPRRASPAPKHTATPSPTPTTTTPRATTAGSTTSTTRAFVSTASHPTSTTSSAPARVATTTTSPSRAPVPNVVGLSFAQAKSRLQSAGDKYFVLCGGAVAGLPNGTVYSQDPPGGSPSAWNTLVEITVLWADPVDPTSAPGPSSGPIAQKPCPYS